MRRKKTWPGINFIVFLALTIFSCNKETIYINTPVYGPTQAFYALSDNNIITAYNAKDVRNIGAQVNISGLATGENVLSIDFRPATGELYGVSSLSKIYIIDAASGIAKPVSNIAFTPALNGAIASLDFNPVTDQIRIVTSAGRNLSLSPETGQTITVGGNVSSSSISGIAHTNSAAGANTTVLYDLDPVAKKLYKQETPDNGTLVPVGNIDLSLGTNLSFDISPDNVNSLAVGKVGDSTKLFTINLANGEATLKGKFRAGTNVRSIAIPSLPVAYAVDNVNNLMIFNPTLKTAAVVNKPLTGLQAGEKIYGIDIRPLNGQLYALGSTSRLYMVNIANGSCTPVGSGPFSTPLLGNSFGFDFNPLTDQIRVVSDSKQSLSINPTTGDVAANPNITLANALPSAVAHDNNFRTTTTTALYVIDHNSDKLYTLTPTTGLLTEIGPIGVNVSETNGFDISSGNVAYAIFTVAGKTNLYQVNLGSGTLTIGLELNQPVTAFALGLKL